MVKSTRVICDSAQLVDGGKGRRFEVFIGDQQLPAFVVRFRGIVYAYVNECRHVGVELDWMEEEFFDFSGLYLICAAHGALYRPNDGMCVAGPCKGSRLIPLGVIEQDGKVYLDE